MSFPRSRRKPVVLVFGESINDAQSVAALIQGMRPDLQGRVRARARPTSLTREAGPAAIRSWVSDLRTAVTATTAGGQPVAAVVVHRDADRPDPTGAVEVMLRRQLAGIAAEVAVPVEAMESWWLLFPTAAESVRPYAWKDRLPRTARNVDHVRDPKSELRRATRSSGKEYTEADSPAIAFAVAGGCHPAVGTSPSWDRLGASARRLP